MDRPEIVLRYQRQQMDFCSGELVLRKDGVETTSAFSRLSFAQMLARLAALLKIADAQTVILERTDKKGMVPIILEADVVGLLKKDPVAAIRYFSPTGISSERLYTPKKKESVPQPAPVFRLGYDVLADTIGTYIYSHLNKDKEVECPGCGYWRPIDVASFTCTNCGLSCAIRTTLTWCRFKTVDLLCTDKPRFFFPRRWNKNGVWILKEDLQALYEEWLLKKDRTDVVF